MIGKTQLYHTYLYPQANSHRPCQLGLGRLGCPVNWSVSPSIVTGDTRLSALPNFIREFQLHDVTHPQGIGNVQQVSGPTNPV